MVLRPLAVRQRQLTPARVEHEALDEVVGRAGLGHGVVRRDGVEDGVATPHLTDGEVVDRLAGRAQAADGRLDPAEERVGLLSIAARLLHDLADHVVAVRLGRDGVGRRRSRRRLHHGVRSAGHQAQRNHLQCCAAQVVRLSAIILLCC